MTRQSRLAEWGVSLPACFASEYVSRVSAAEGMKAQHPSANGVMKEWRTMTLK